MTVPPARILRAPVLGSIAAAIDGLRQPGADRD
ncbi:hypothetical protein M878_44740 [Streptomyces roseochromogenus subsp. oscitans DS 12.976]|uniref:Uncharacterized protein n=1 Tax=Streptomyces roseochromogenus subsp. oscitans DS 12.976 TaxID=1352936 RepID=V6JFF2_STRRC|nr:hypothetical protein M878_44740 [Streptomyces roseochromogenus subsp. oscitans DS 12.976]